MIELTTTSHGTNPPQVVHVGAVAPDLLGVTIHARHVTPSRIIPYRKQPGDKVIVKKKIRTGEIKEAVLKRDGEEIAWVIGKSNDFLCLFEHVVGEPLQTDIADQPQTYTITSADDTAYTNGLHPRHVWRKSKPTDWPQPRDGIVAPMEHTMYLHLPAPLREGVVYRVDMRSLNTQPGTLEYTYTPSAVRSEAVHVNQTGYRCDDPVKRAYLSIWLGNGGAYSYREPLRFSVCDAATDERVFTGVVELAFAADQPEKLKRNANYSGTDVYHMDFSAVTNPGTYRVCVEGIGCSYLFPIGRDAWRVPFRTVMRGFYHQRSGLAIGPPYTDYVRPRNFHPDDGVIMYASTMRTGEGNLEDLAERHTDEIITAYGGYHDAGDWDRRVQHLDCSRAHLELLELFPAYFARLSLDIPESGNAMPDLLDEVLWNLEFYRKLQKADGGVRHGIESASHPREGEVSWMESFTMAAFEADVWSTYIYAGVAARAARALEHYDDALATTYAESALRAMQWAESHRSGAPANSARKVQDERNLAALELYRLTSDRHWHQVFKRTTVLDSPADNAANRQLDAAFLYARLPAELADSDLAHAATNAVIQRGGNVVAYAQGNAFNLTHYNKYMPMILGFFSTPQCGEAVRAHYLTGDQRFLDAAILGCNFGLGANPMNIVLTTGLGANPVRHPLHIDSRCSGQKAPDGLVLYGLNDYVAEIERGDYGGYLTWPFKWFFDKQCTPKGSSWPVNESYFDVGAVPSMCEFTVHQNLGPAAYVWGYLAARP
jgi:endoglucanase